MGFYNINYCRFSTENSHVTSIPLEIWDAALGLDGWSWGS